MKAAICRAFGAPLTIEDVSLRAPQGSEVEVEIAACAICHSDITYIDGGWGGTLPAIYGHEAAGVVSRVGPQAASVKPGDHVAVTLLRSCGRCHYCAAGSPHLCETTFPLDDASPLAGANGEPIMHGLKTAAFAEAALVEESQVAKLPPDLGFDVASLLSCGVLTGFGAVVNTAKVPFGASVAVIGTGGVGLNCVQGAALSGAQPIIAIDIADEKLKASKEFRRHRDRQRRERHGRRRGESPDRRARRRFRLRFGRQRRGREAGPVLPRQRRLAGRRRHAGERRDDRL